MSKVNISELSQAKNLVHVLFDADFAEGLISQGWGHKFYLLHFQPSAPLGRSSYPGAERGPREILVSEQFQHLPLMCKLNHKMISRGDNFDTVSAVLKQIIFVHFG